MTPSRSTVVGAALLAMAASMPLAAQRAPRALLALLAHADDETASLAGDDLFR